MIVYLLRDPETTRISLQAHEPDDGSFPRGPRGLDWEVRRGEIPESTWDDLLAGRLTPGEQTDLHRSLWEAAA